MNSIIGITTANGYPFLSFKERFSLFSKIGFKSILLWWGDDEHETRQERVALAKEYGLQIENAHADMENSNSLWENSLNGDKKTSELISAIEDCKKYGIGRLIIHLTNGENPPDITDIGLRRFEKILENAIKNDIILAIENVRTEKHIRFILDNYKGRHIAFCYDSGHANIWCKHIDWLSLYGDRLAAVHLHDNDGTHDSHRIPFTGTVDWKRVFKQIAESSYNGAMTIEAEYHDVKETVSLEVFLKQACNSGINLGEHYITNFANK